jgi:hypothetical protein
VRPGSVTLLRVPCYNAGGVVTVTAVRDQEAVLGHEQPTLR